jgi:hypothetical protein
MSDWMEPKRERPPQEAIDELHRELTVRQRCFPRWIGDGRVSATDAQDRIDRLATAHDLLVQVFAADPALRVTSSGDKTEAGQKSNV